MTPRQLTLLQFIRRHALQHGSAPSLREMATGLRVASPAVPLRMLIELEAQGMVERRRDRWRTTELTAKGIARADAATVSAGTATLLASVSDADLLQEVARRGGIFMARALEGARFGRDAA